MTKMNEHDWWQKTFDQKYLDTYLGKLTDERTKQETDFVIEAAKLKPSDTILDLACGHGRHSIELAKRGFKHIIGLDYSQTFIDKAVADAAADGVEVRFVQGDMKFLPYDSEFDVVLTLFTTLGYFDDETNQAVLNQVSKSLLPGGRFWLDNIRAETVEKRFEEEGVFDSETGLLKISRRVELTGRLTDETEWYDSEKQVIHSHREWRDNGEKKEYDMWLHVYTMPQWEQMLSNAGFTIVNTWSDYEGKPFDEDNSHGFIILAKKTS